MLKWYREKKKAKEEAEKLYQQDLDFAASSPRLHGVNLLEWRYLGRTVISYCDEETKAITSSTNIFGFCKIDDVNQRQFVVAPAGRYNPFEYHTWVTEHAALWKIGERELWTIATTEPSKWLKEHMLETYDELWSVDDNWWVKKGTQPKRKPKLELVKDDNNVVKLDFAKKTKKEET